VRVADVGSEEFQDADAVAEFLAWCADAGVASIAQTRAVSVFEPSQHRVDFADGVGVGWSFFELPHDGVADQVGGSFLIV
jgi:hypothetical protein